MSDCTEHRFLKDVENHKLAVIRDDGVYRHLSFTNNGSSVYRFDLITWPGFLCVCGDMGTYVFRRLHDMFEFFRQDREYNQRKGRALSINLGYWSEKLEAVTMSNPSTRSGYACEYSPDIFRRIVKEQLVNWWREELMTRQQRRDLREAIESDVLAFADDGDIRAFDAANNFKHEHFEFHDFWEYDLTDYTFHFVWICYAIAWGIQQYDDFKDAAKVAA